MVFSPTGINGRWQKDGVWWVLELCCQSGNLKDLLHACKMNAAALLQLWLIVKLHKTFQESSFVSPCLSVEEFFQDSEEDFFFIYYSWLVLFKVSSENYVNTVSAHQILGFCFGFFVWLVVLFSFFVRMKN